MFADFAILLISAKIISSKINCQSLIWRSTRTDQAIIAYRRRWLLSAYGF